MNNFSIGVHDATRAPLLSPAEERELTRQAAAGCPAAKERLALANTRLVVSIVKRYANRGVPFDDLFQEGVIGLMTGIEKFDPRQGFKLSTYASWWIRQSVTRAVANQGRSIRLPVYKQDEVIRLFGVISELSKANGDVRPSPAEIAQHMGLSVDQVRSLLDVARRPLSLNDPGGSDDGAEFGHFIADDQAIQPAEQAAGAVLASELTGLLDTLPPREARVIRLRFGFDGRPHTLDEVGQKFGVTRERARQIQEQALRRLRHPRRSRRLRGWL